MSDRPTLWSCDLSRADGYQFGQAHASDMLEQLQRMSVLVPVEPRWWVEREDGQRIAGPFTTADDAIRARVWVEKGKGMAPEDLVGLGGGGALMSRRVYDDPEYRRIRKQMRSEPCRYCGKVPTPGRPTTVHHRVSVRRGGGNTPSNLIPLCQSCNNRVARLEAKYLTPGQVPMARARWGLRKRQLNQRAIEQDRTNG